MLFLFLRVVPVLWRMLMSPLLLMRYLMRRDGLDVGARNVDYRAEEALDKIRRQS